MSNDAPENRAGDVYGPLLAASLAGEMGRKASIEQRSLAVVTMSGVLVSLLVALSMQLLGDSKCRTPDVMPRVLLAVAVVAFIGAASVALAANSPKDYRVFSEADIDRMVKDWNGKADEAAFLVGEFQAAQLKRAYGLNNGKARLLQVAVGVELIGVTLVAGATAIILLSC